MKVKALISFITILFVLSADSFAQRLGGRENDGAWPDNARNILEALKQDLMFRLRKVTTEEIQLIIKQTPNSHEYYIAPESVTQNYLIELIGGIRQKTNLELENDSYQGMRLFYYGKDEQGIYIEALKNYYKTYEQYSVENIPIDIRKDIEKKLLHEASHTWGYGEEEAKEFSGKLISELYLGKKLGGKSIFKALNITLLRSSFNADSFRYDLPLNSSKWSCLKFSWQSETDVSTKFETVELNNYRTHAEFRDRGNCFFLTDGLTCNQEKIRTLIRQIGSGDLVIEKSEDMSWTFSPQINRSQFGNHYEVKEISLCKEGIIGNEGRLKEELYSNYIIPYADSYYEFLPVTFNDIHDAHLSFKIKLKEMFQSLYHKMKKTLSLPEPRITMEDVRNMPEYERCLNANPFVSRNERLERCMKTTKVIDQVYGDQSELIVVDANRMLMQFHTFVQSQNSRQRQLLGTKIMNELMSTQQAQMEILKAEIERLMLLNRKKCSEFSAFKKEVDCMFSGLFKILDGSQLQDVMARADDALAQKMTILMQEIENYQE